MEVSTLTTKASPLIRKNKRPNNCPPGALGLSHSEKSWGSYGAPGGYGARRLGRCLSLRHPRGWGGGSLLWKVEAPSKRVSSWPTTRASCKPAWLRLGHSASTSSRNSTTAFPPSASCSAFSKASRSLCSDCPAPLGHPTPPLSKHRKLQLQNFPFKHFSLRSGFSEIRLPRSVLIFLQAPRAPTALSVEVTKLSQVPLDAVPSGAIPSDRSACHHRWLVVPWLVVPLLVVPFN